MSYSSSIPNASDPRAQSQKQILANFQAINSVWAVNHSSLIGTDEQGQHDVLTMRRQSGDPTTTATQVALYNKLVSSIPELFFRPASNGTPIQLTSSSISDNTSFPDDEYTFVAGPFIVYAGIMRNPAGIPQGTVKTLVGGTTLLFASLTTFSASRLTIANTPLYAMASTLNTPANSFTVDFVAGTLKIPILYYLAVGV
jgi:hypothetical protein